MAEGLARKFQKGPGDMERGQYPLTSSAPDHTPRHLILPKPRKPIRRQRRIARRRLQIPMPEIVRQRSGVVTIVC